MRQLPASGRDNRRGDVWLVHLTLPKGRWLGMVADRYMPMLAGFGDDGLQAGIAEVDARYPGPLLEF